LPAPPPSARPEPEQTPPLEIALSRAPLAPYPALRPRRLRQADWIRRLVRETTLTPDDLIWSMVVHDGDGRASRWPPCPASSGCRCARPPRRRCEARALGIPAIAVFPHIDGAKKDARPEAADPTA
jgi:porphobilinogen synthase